MKNNFDGIEVLGAKEHNLKNISLKVPRNKITVITGLSGSGKSSLAFDTIYAEGQRRYLEGLSAYARNFLEQLKKPEVDAIYGLSPAVSIDQKTSGTNPRSTVGTVTESYDFLRLLFAKVAIPHCPNGHGPVSNLSEEEITDQICNLPQQTKIVLLLPMARQKKGEFSKEFKSWIKKGFIRAKVDGEFIELENAKKLAKTKAHDVDLVVDRISINSNIRSRIGKALVAAATLSKGQLIVEDHVSKEQEYYSLYSSCATCGFSFPEMDPKSFSFNNPKGACGKCNGLGILKFSDDEEEDESGEESDELSLKVCPACEGSRLKKEALFFFFKGRNIYELSELSIKDLFDFFANIKLSTREKNISAQIIKQLSFRLEYLAKVGVGYLSLNRPARTLSGGESQRIRLASQMGNGLVGVLYVLDEPSIGLHPQDHDKLLSIISSIRDRGNTILMVEHDEDTILSADLVYDLGPLAGVNGGSIIASGSPTQLMKTKESLTGHYLARKKRVYQPKLKRELNSGFIKISKAKGFNLKNIDIDIPLHAFTTVTGVSGSGKSSLVIDTFYKHLANTFNKASYTTLEFNKITGLESVKRVVNINQKPIGRTPRSNPATYTGVLTLIRKLFSEHPESKIRGFGPGHFSFNIKGGRCETCQGAGQKKVEMNFLSNVFVECDVCLGQRYNHEALSIRFKEKNISDVLDMSIEQAVSFFTKQPQIKKKLDTLMRVGLGYIKLGQSSTTLSGGEAQRVKLSKELSKRNANETIYILDEPTTGLHFEDVSKLLELLHELVDQGNTVLVIEHNLSVIDSSDYIVELGPEGGPNGGSIINSGPYAKFIQNPSSTAKYLVRYNSINTP